MSTKSFSPRVPTTPNITDNPVAVPEPLTRPEKQKIPIMMLIMLPIMALMLAVMIIFQMSSGQPFNPMMGMMFIMMPLMMIGSMAASFGNKGNIEEDRKNYMVALRETRKQVDSNAQALRKAQIDAFPSPKLMPNLVGNTSQNYPIMWQVSDSKTKGIRADIISTNNKDTENKNPFLAPYMGVTPIAAYPALNMGEIEVAENLEPASYISFRHFIELQSIVPDIPVGYPLHRHPFVAVVGEGEDCRGFARTWMLSLAFAHKPGELILHVATDKPKEWEWAKWLPHMNTGKHINMYPTWEEAADYISRETVGRGKSIAVKAISTDKPAHVLFIDVHSGGKQRIPTSVPPQGREGWYTVFVDYRQDNMLFNVPKDSTILVEKPEEK